MNRNHLLIAVALGSVACEKGIEAPEGLSDLALHLFEHFEDEDTEEFAAGVLNVEPIAHDLDLNGSFGDRWIADELEPMTDAQLGSLEKHDGVVWEEQLPRIGFAESPHPLEDHIPGQLEPNQICIDSGTTKYHARTFVEGEDCFGDQSCDELVTTAEIRKESLIAKVWYDYEKDFRLFEVDKDRTGMMARGYLPEISWSDGDNKSWNQIFTMELWIPDADDPSKTWRYYAIYSYADLGVGDEAYASAVKGGIEEGFERADLWIEEPENVEDWCGQDRDYEYDRP